MIAFNDRLTISASYDSMKTFDSDNKFLFYRLQSNFTSTPQLWGTNWWRSEKKRSYDYEYKNFEIVCKQHVTIAYFGNWNCYHFSPSQFHAGEVQSPLIFKCGWKMGIIFLVPIQQPRSQPEQCIQHESPCIIYVAWFTFFSDVLIPWLASLTKTVLRNFRGVQRPSPTERY